MTLIIGEALNLRADLQKRVAQLQERVAGNADGVNLSETQSIADRDERQGPLPDQRAAHSIDPCKGAPGQAQTGSEPQAPSAQQHAARNLHHGLGITGR
jgi:hypothetical protein